MAVVANDQVEPGLQPATAGKQAAAEPNSGEDVLKKGLRPKRTATFRDYIVGIPSANTIFL